MLNIDSQLCINCGMCVMVCSYMALRRGPEGIIADLSSCLNCTTPECVVACPMDAIVHNIGEECDI